MVWSHVNEGPLSRNYTVIWIPASPSGVSSKQGITGTLTTITALRSNTNYMFTLTAVNEAGSGIASNSVSMQTGCYLFAQNIIAVSHVCKHLNK